MSRYGSTSSEMEKSVYVSLEFRAWGRNPVLSVCCERATAYCTMNVAARLMDCNNPPSCLNPNLPVIFFCISFKMLLLTFSPSFFYCNPPPPSVRHISQATVAIIRRCFAPRQTTDIPNAVQSLPLHASISIPHRTCYMLHAQSTLCPNFQI